MALITSHGLYRETMQKIREAFDPEALRRICEMPEEEFAHAYGMGRYEVSQQAAPNNFYHYIDNGGDVLAVAHLDTVSPRDERGCAFIDTEAGQVVFSRALDDRLGAYVILELLPKMGLKFDVLLTVGEESGQSTALYFDSPKEYNWMFEFDRGGTDVVMYQYDDTATRKLVRETGAKVGDGIFSDISYMDHLEIKGFNWGVGYQDYHGPRSHAFLEDTFDMVESFLDFFDTNQDVYLPHDSSESDSYGYGYGKYARRTPSRFGGWVDDPDDFRPSDFDPTAYDVIHRDLDRDPTPEEIEEARQFQEEDDAYRSWMAQQYG